MTLRVKSPYRVEWLFLFNTGTVYVDVYRMKLQAQMKLDSVNGRLIPRMSKCDARIPVLTVRFEGGLVNQIMNLFEDRIGQAIQGTLRKMKFI